MYLISLELFSYAKSQDMTGKQGFPSVFVRDHAVRLRDHENSFEEGSTKKILNISAKLKKFRAAKVTAEKN